MNVPVFICTFIIIGGLACIALGVDVFRKRRDGVDFLLGAAMFFTGTFTVSWGVGMLVPGGGS